MLGVVFNKPAEADLQLLLFVYFPVASIWMDLFSELTTG